MSAHPLPIPGPLSIGDIIDRAFRIYRARFKPMLLTALMLLAPLAVLTGLLSFLLSQQTLAAAEAGDVTTTVGASLGSAVISLLGWLVQGLAELALTFHAFAALHDQTLEPGAALRAAGGRIGAWLAAALLRALAYLAMIIVPLVPTIGLAAIAGDSPGLAAGLSCLFLIVMLVVVGLAIVLQTRWVITTACLVNERLGATGALGRSWQLTRGKFWRAFGVTLVLGLIALVVLSLPNILLQAVALANSARTPLFSALGTAFGTVLSALFVPLSAATYVVLYYDLRVRRENLDLDVRVQQLEADATHPEEPQP